MIGESGLISEQLEFQIWRRPDAIALRTSGQNASEFTWREVGSLVERCRGELQSRGIGTGTRVALFGANSWKWVVCDWALLGLGAIPVPLYPGVSAEDSRTILDDSGARWIIALEKIAGIPAGVTSLSEIDLRISEHESETLTPLEISGASAATLVYTSGTMGIPRGVLISHRQLAEQAAALAERFELAPLDLSVSHLPFAHIMGRLEGYLPLYSGGTLGFSPSPKDLDAALVGLRPTFLVTVPKVLNRMARAIAGTDERKRLRSLLGGRLRMWFSGGAAVTPEVSALFAELGFPVLEGYGMTETSGAITMNVPGDFRVGTAGRAFNGIELRVENDGEISVRGSSVFHKYLNDRKSALTEAGWFATGDLGEIDEQGYLSILDRKKDLIALSGGKKVAPQKLESRLKGIPGVSEAFVIGEGQPYVTALLLFGEGAIASDQALRESVARLNAELGAHEQIRDFRAIEGTLSREARELTASLKVRRARCLENYQGVWEGMYGAGKH